MPFSEMFNADLTLKSKEDRIKVLKDAGISLDKPITTSCQMGVTACVLYHALRDISECG